MQICGGGGTVRCEEKKIEGKKRMKRGGRADLPRERERWHHPARFAPGCGRRLAILYSRWEDSPNLIVSGSGLVAAREQSR
jgi:hypothetical protein